MAKRKELLEKHPYKISQGKDGNWRTYLSDKKNGRKLVKRKILNIDKITEEDIKVFIVSTEKSKQLCKKTCKILLGYVRNTIKSAKINKMISDEDMKLLYQWFQKDYQEHPAYIPTYAVLTDDIRTLLDIVKLVEILKISVNR